MIMGVSRYRLGAKLSGESDKRPMQKTLVDPGKQLSRHEFESRHIQCIHLVKGVSMRNQFRALTAAAIYVLYNVFNEPIAMSCVSN